MSDEIPLVPFAEDEPPPSDSDSDDIRLEPGPPKKKPLPGQVGSPLPRLWKLDPEDAPAEEPKKAPKPKKPSAGEPLFDPKKAKDAQKAKEAKKKAKEAKDPDGKTVLVEETPEVDTYEYRQRVRTIVGIVGLAGMLLFGLVIFLMFSSSSKEEIPDPVEPTALVSQKAASGRRELDEAEARSMFNRAKDAAKIGKVELAISFLNTVSSKYPATKAAKEAQEALERPTRNLPLFPDGPTVVADLGKAVPKSPAPKSESPQPSASVPASVESVPKQPEVEAVEPPMPTEPTPAVSAIASVLARPNRRLPNGFHPRPGTELDRSGWPLEIVGERDESTLVLVPGGIFIQGRNDADPSESPEHEVKLSSYYIDKHEVTNRQFDLFQREAGRRSERARAMTKEFTPTKPDAKTTAGGSASKADFPAVMVTAREAKDYAEWAGKNLPTEAQWEIAGRTSDGRIHPWGPTPPTWSKPRAPKQIDAVEAYPEDVSPYGAFDLAGNAWEWTKDWFDSRYYYQFKNSTAENPNGPSSSRVKLITVRGGDKDWGLSRREGLKADTRLPYLGFRCVLQVEGPGNVFEPKPPPKPPTNRNLPGNGLGSDNAVPF